MSNETVSTTEELDALPNFTVIVSAPADMEGKTVTIAAQKIAGDWYAVGTPFPLRPEDLTPAFWPAEVVHRLTDVAPEAADADAKGGLG